MFARNRGRPIECGYLSRSLSSWARSWLPDTSSPRLRGRTPLSDRLNSTSFSKRHWVLSILKRSISIGALALLDDGAALLPHELHHVVGAAAALSGGAGALPAAEGLGARPGSGRRAAPLVDVGDARLDLVEEPLHLCRVAREEPGREAVLGLVGLFDPLRQGVDLPDGEH